MILHGGQEGLTEEQVKNWLGAEMPDRMTPSKGVKFSLVIRIICDFPWSNHGMSAYRGHV